MSKRARKLTPSVKQLVTCFNERYRKHRCAALQANIRFGDWLSGEKRKLQSRGDLWGKIFEDSKIEYSQGTAEKYMSIAGNSVMRDSAHAQIWPCSMYKQYLLSTIRDSQLLELIRARRIHPKLTREETELLQRRANSTRRNRAVTFGRSINGAIHTDLWHNRLDQLFGLAVTGRKRTPAQHIFEFGKRHLQTPLEVIKAMMTLSTLLPQDRYFLGDGEPKKYDLLLQNLFQHEKVEAVLNDFARPLGPHKEEEYLARLMNEAYAAYRADRGEAVDAAEAADEAA